MAREAALESPSMIPARRKPIVLAVDDEPDILFALREAFAEFLPSVELHTAQSGPEGLKVLAKHAADVILADYKMPQMNGIDFLKAARTVVPAAKSLMVTAYPSKSLAEQAIKEAGASLVIAKPFDAEALAGAVDVLIQQILLAREP